MSRMKDYEQYLWGCRFCPMCKPASDALNATYRECNATRAHAMIIWRTINENEPYSEKEIELLYQSNLDGVSEAFCVDHYPVTGYMLAAREDIVETGRAPAPVAAVLRREQKIRSNPKGSVLVFAEGADIDFDIAWKRGESLANRLGAGLIAGFGGYAPYMLGGRAKAVEEARSLADAIRKTGARAVVTTGPESYDLFTRIYPELGISLDLDTVYAARLLFTESGASGVAGRKVFVHDARAAYPQSETKPDEKVIMPDFFGPEELLGTGEAYELPRQALKKGGAELTFSVWSRAMAGAMGNDDALALTYPELARKMARRRLRMIEQTGAELLVSDSLATIVYLDTLEKDLLGGLEAKYLGEL